MIAQGKKSASFTDALFKSVYKVNITQFTFAGHKSEIRRYGDAPLNFFVQETQKILENKKPTLASIDQDYIEAFKKWTSDPPHFSSRALGILLALSEKGSPAIAPSLRDALRSETFTAVPDILKTALLLSASSVIAQWILCDDKTDFLPEQKQAVLDIIDTHIQHGYANEQVSLNDFTSIAVAFPDELLEYGEKLRPFLPSVESLQQYAENWQRISSFIQSVVPVQNAARVAALFPEYQELFIQQPPKHDAEPPPP